MLHDAEFEIVLPSFMNQGQMDHAIRVLPTTEPVSYRTSAEEPDTKAESIIFDKADAVAQLEELTEQRESLREEITGFEDQAKAKGETIGPWIERHILWVRKEEERLDAMIQKLKERKLD